jgi:hypothetical protein
MKTITICPGSGEVSEKTASGSPGDDFSGLTGGLWAVDVTAGRKNKLACTQGDVYFLIAGSPKL